MRHWYCHKFNLIQCRKTKNILFNLKKSKHDNLNKQYIAIVFHALIILLSHAFRWLYFEKYFLWILLRKTKIYTTYKQTYILFVCMHVDIHTITYINIHIYIKYIFNIYPGNAPAHARDTPFMTQHKNWSPPPLYIPPLPSYRKGSRGRLHISGKGKQGNMIHVHTEKSFQNLIKSNRNQSVFTVD